jgi:hypothetical protein
VNQSNGGELKARAEECRRAAEQAISPEDREGWLRLAAQWEKLATAAEERRGIYDRYE